MNLILGGSGLVGSALVRVHLKNDLLCIYPSSKELNLLNFSDVYEYFSTVKPKRVFFSSGKSRGDISQYGEPDPFY